MPDEEEPRAQRPEQPDPKMIPRDDPYASPLGRGANPGPAVEGGPITASGIAGTHGHNIPGEKGGVEGILHRENEDQKQPTR